MNKMLQLRATFEPEVSENVLLAQAKQYDKRQGLAGEIFIERNHVLLKDLKRADRKGGKRKTPWF